MIRKVTINDAQQICAIYNHYIINSTVTFEEELVDQKEMVYRIERLQTKYPWLVFEKDNELIGYANVVS